MIETHPEILTHPNIPKPLHGMSPRTLLGQDWWDTQRHAAYKRSKFRCMACGVPKRAAKYHRWLEAHEYYSYDYAAGSATLIQIVALCHSCHNFIHSGRMSHMVRSGEMPREKVMDILGHGFRVLTTAGMKPFWFTSFLWLTLNGHDENESYKWLEENGYVQEGDEGPSDWSKWHIIIPGAGTYYSKFKDYDDWARAYGHPTKDEQVSAMVRKELYRMMSRYPMDNDMGYGLYDDD